MGGASIITQEAFGEKHTELYSLVIVPVWVNVTNHPHSMLHTSFMCWVCFYLGETFVL